MNDLNLERKPLKITDSRVIEIFLDAQRVRLLEPFISIPCTIADAAKSRGQSVNKMAYWVGQFVGLGLLREVTPAISRRAATYLTTSQHFVIEDLDTLLLREYTKEQFGPLWQAYIENLYLDAKKYADLWDFHVLTDEAGSMIRDFAPAWQREQYRYNPEGVVGDSSNTWALLPLSRDDARQFMTRLEQLLAEYVQKADQSPEARIYLVHLGLVRHYQGED